MTRTVPISEFEARCLDLLDEVNATGETLVVTTCGQPIARVSPAAAPPSLVGSVRSRVSDEGLIAPVGEQWDAERGSPA